MSFNLLDSIKGMVTPDLISTASSFLGENSSGVSKAVEAAVPALLNGVISKAGSDSGSVLELAKQAAGSGVLDNVLGLFGSNNSSMMNLGSSLLSGIFGNKSSLLTNLISGFAGIKPSSASSLMSLLAPVALGSLGKHALSSGLDAKGLLGFLGSQKDSITKALPAGLDLSSVLGSGIAGTVKKAVPVVEEEKKGMGWLLPLLLLVGGGLLLWYFMGGKKEEAPAPPPATETITPVSTDSLVPAVKEVFKVELPNGTVLEAFKGGIEDQLVNFLKDASAQAGKDVWFDFDNLNFNTGTADITAESQVQISNIAAILKAFPKAKVKIGGYTDKTGDENANLKLSRERAEAVSAALGKAGVGAQVTGAEGYGSQFAKAAADGPESEKLKDRRVSVSVREK